MVTAGLVRDVGCGWMRCGCSSGGGAVWCMCCMVLSNKGKKRVSEGGRNEDVAEGC